MEVLCGNERQPGGDERQPELPHLFGRAAELQEDVKDPCLNAARSFEQQLKSLATDMNARFDQQEARHLDVARNLELQLQNVAADVQSRFDEQESFHRHAVSNSERQLLNLTANMQTHLQIQEQLLLQRNVQQPGPNCEEDMKRKRNNELRDSRITFQGMDSEFGETKTDRLVRVVGRISANVTRTKRSLKSNASSDVTYERLCRAASAKIAAAQDLEVLNSSEPDFWVCCICLRSILQSNAYTAWMFLVTVANSIILGMQVEASPTSFVDQLWTGYDIADAVCTLIFTCDVVLKVCCLGCVSYCWTNVDRCWNILDATVAGCGLVDLLITKILALHGLVLGHVTFLRVLRILRLLRTIRVLKLLRFTQSLRSLLFSITTAMKSVFWALVMMFLIIYIFAVALTQATATFCTEHLVSDPATASMPLACHNSDLAAYWSSLPSSVITLFQASSQGLNWGRAAEALAEVGIVWYAIFMIYIALMSFTVLNVITGVFCHNAIEAANYDSDIAAMMHVAKQEACTAALVTALKAGDEDDPIRLSCMTLDTFEDKIQSPKVRAIMDFMGLDSVDPVTLFKLFDSDCKGFLDIEEFVTACMQLKGCAKAHQLAKLGYEQSHMKKSVEALRVSVDALADRLLPHQSKRSKNTSEEMVD